VSPVDRPVAVLGAGNWGTTLAHLVAKNGHRVMLWTRHPDQRDEINGRHTNARSVPDLALHPGVSAVTDLGEAIGPAELVVVAIPSQSFRAVSRIAGDVLQPDHLVVHVTKGLEVRTHRRMTEILAEETCAAQVGVLAGPNIAAEIAMGKPAGTVITSAFPRVIEVTRRALSSEQLMVFAGADVVGVELAGALKNVVAIAAGMATELDIGENAKALLVTRGLREISRVGVAMGAHPMTFAGLAGIGDLMVTCASSRSRNNRVGRALARGELLADILAALGMVAEGVYAAVSARELAAARRIEAPLLERVHRVLYEGLPVVRALEDLMRLPAGRDVGARWPGRSG